MKHRKLLAFAGIVLSCNICFAACHSNSSKQSSNKENIKTKQEVKKKKSNVKKGQVPGVDKPTDDGFLFTSESQIKARTSDGLILDHDGHTHFIFYSDLKNSKWAYLIPKDGQAPAASAAQNLNQSNALDDGYVFNPKDIVSEDENGYIVRHGDHYHYIWKSSLKGSYGQGYQSQTVSSGNASGGQNLPHSHPNYTNPPSRSQQQETRKRRFAGIDYPTSDGFLFNGMGITGKTATGLLVDHNGHTHFIPYEQLIQSKWEYVIPAEYKKAAEDAYYGRQSQTPSTPSPSKEDEEIAKKKAYLAQQLGIDESLIEVIDTDKGKAFLYPHGDHKHSTLINDIDMTKPFNPHGDPHAHDKVGMATLKALGFDDEIIEDILHATAETEFPSNEANLEKMKAWLRTVKYLNIGQRKDPLERKGLDLMPNIEVLGIGFTAIKNIRPVLQFKHLKQLWMTKTGVTNYDFLKEIPTLEGLDISQNGISDLSFLKNYPNLKTVAAAGNDIHDITALAQLKNLESLNLDYNRISNISALANLSKLQAVSLEHNQLQDISVLDQKANLTRLFLSNNPNLDINTLKTSALAELTVNESNIQSLDFLKNNPALTNVTMNGNRLTSLSGIEAAKNLVTFTAHQNQIKTLAITGNQTSVKELNLSNNELKNLEGVNQFAVLENLDVSKNKLTTIAISAPNRTVQYIDVSHNYILKSELELNEKQIPKALAQYFSAVKGGRIEGNPLSGEKEGEKNTIKKESEVKTSASVQEQVKDIELHEKTPEVKKEEEKKKQTESLKQSTDKAQMETKDSGKNSPSSEVKEDNKEIKSIDKKMILSDKSSNDAKVKQ